MAALTTVALVVGAVAAVAGTAHSIESSKQAARLSGQERDRQQSMMDQAEKKLKLRQENEAAIETSRQLRSRKRESYDGAATKGDTIKTSALGVVQQAPNNPRRTLLGE